MENKDLPFPINSEYELYELDLEVIETERIKGYDSYKYLKTITFNGIEYPKIELIFSMDILQIVIMANQQNTIIYGNTSVMNRILK